MSQMTHHPGTAGRSAAQSRDPAPLWVWVAGAAAVVALFSLVFWKISDAQQASTPTYASSPLPAVAYPGPAGTTVQSIPTGPAPVSSGAPASVPGITGNTSGASVPVAPSASYATAPAAPIAGAAPAPSYGSAPATAGYAVGGLPPRDGGGRGTD